jgi:hypothetical protein
MVPPESKRFLKWQADAFEEEAQLHPPAMAKVVALVQLLNQTLHAQWEGLLRNARDICRSEALGDTAFFVTRLAADIPFGERLDNGLHAAILLTRELLPPSERAYERFGELVAEFACDKAADVALMYDGIAAFKQAAVPADKMGHVLEGDGVEGAIFVYAGSGITRVMGGINDHEKRAQVVFTGMDGALGERVAGKVALVEKLGFMAGEE